MNLFLVIFLFYFFGKTNPSRLINFSNSSDKGLCKENEIYLEQVYRTRIYSQQGFWKTSYKTRGSYEMEPRERVVFKCCKGYAKSLDGSCVPICPEGCLNGFCDEPNKCSCFSGYSSDVNASHICQPTCGDHDCGKYGTCIAPNVCKCLNGYQSQVNNPCIPFCNPPCKNAECISPNNCVCNEGYSKQMETNECEPICHPKCFNGICVSPNKCECFEGFKKSLSFDNECLPNCNPACKEPLAFCISPGKCACLNGYELNENNISCKPICSDMCENGYCDAPNTCVCNELYKPHDNLWHKCLPTCSLGCINANCTAPDNCTCHDGHEIDLVYETAHVCVPTCHLQCINGNCTAPDECTCLDGYEKDDNVLSGHVCIPKCEDTCTGGYCDQPDVCICFEGYSRINDTYCELNCSTECIHAICEDIWQLKNCTCPLGYTLFGRGRCIPDCFRFCHSFDENCLPDTHCHCQIGYKPNEFSICESLCLECNENNGRCNDLGECECKPGYYGNDCSNEELCTVCQDNNTMACQYNNCDCLLGWEGPCLMLNKNCSNYTDLYNISSCICVSDKSSCISLNSNAETQKYKWYISGGSISIILLSIIFYLLFRLYTSRKFEGNRDNNENIIFDEDNDIIMN